MLCLASFVLVLFLVSNVQAADVTWTDVGPDHLWSTPTNWSSGTVPTSSDRVLINILPGPIIANEGAVAYALGVGYWGSGSDGGLTVNGGTLTTSVNFRVGWGPDTRGTVNMNSGTITGNVLFVGHQGSGTLNMTGGTITVTGDFFIPNKDIGTGHVNLDGGIITANNFEMRREAGSVGTMNIRAGTLIINSDKVSTAQRYIDNGWITAYDGDGTLQLDYDVTNEGKTTLSATHMLNPNPDDGVRLAAAGDVELSWTLPDPCVPGQPVSVDVYVTDDLQALEWFTDPAAIQVVSKQNVTSVVVRTKPKTQYYWAVDTYIGDPNDPVFGPIFSFVVDNLPPEVDAGANAVTWLVDGTMTKNLDATITDEDANIVQWWTVVSEPNAGNAVIETLTAEDTSVTLAAVGEYVLQLEAFDGEYTGSDTVTINVYNNGCEAAQSLPDYEASPGDLNGDCIVDDLDLAILQEDWLTDTSLTEP